MAPAVLMSQRALWALIQVSDSFQAMNFRLTGNTGWATLPLNHGLYNDTSGMQCGWDSRKHLAKFARLRMLFIRQDWCATPQTSMNWPTQYPYDIADLQCRGFMQPLYSWKPERIVVCLLNNAHTSLQYKTYKNAVSGIQLAQLQCVNGGLCHPITFLFC